MEHWARQATTISIKYPRSPGRLCRTGQFHFPIDLLRIWRGYASLINEVQRSYKAAVLKQVYTLYSYACAYSDDVITGGSMDEVAWVKFSGLSRLDIIKIPWIQGHLWIKSVVSFVQTIAG